MKIWAALRNNDKILDDKVLTFSSNIDWEEIVGEICREFDLSRPLILKKHINDLDEFRHTVFTADDFMEPVSFKKMSIEMFPEKKNSSF